VGEWVQAAEVAELTRRKRKQVVIAGEAIALFLINGTVYALHDVCIHKQNSLSKGTVLNGRIICPGHQWSFDPATGWVADQQRCQPTYDVLVENDKVYIDPARRIRRTEPAP
jgi:nitrite reductase/ring-hydroxylating ferredoxin subunit